VTRFVNPAMARMLGYAPEELLGRRIHDFVAPVARAQPEKNLARRERGADERHDMRLRCKDGSDLLATVSASTLFDAQGNYRGSLKVVSDVREQRRLELKVQQAQKLESLGVLSGGIAHDFNNLLAGILGNVSLALDELPRESPVVPVLEDARTAAQRAAELTRQMLAYSGQGRFVIERLDLNRLVSEMSRLLSTAISKRAALKLHRAEPLPQVLGDATQLRQVIMNLITNASDALEDRNGVVSISTGLVQAKRAYLAATYMDDDLKEEPYVFLEVSDTGVGMDAATREKIFDPFFTTKFTGRGLAARRFTSRAPRS
jgi:PAS domain S-box-containing protein